MWRRPGLDWTYFMCLRMGLCTPKPVLPSVLAAVSMSLARQHKEPSFSLLSSWYFSFDIESTQLPSCHAHSYHAHFVPRSFFIKYPACISLYRIETASFMKADIKHDHWYLKLTRRSLAQTRPWQKLAKCHPWTIVSLGTILPYCRYSLHLLSNRIVRVCPMRAAGVFRSTACSWVVSLFSGWWPLTLPKNSHSLLLD